MAGSYSGVTEASQNTTVSSTDLHSVIDEYQTVVGGLISTDNTANNWLNDDLVRKKRFAPKPFSLLWKVRMPTLQSVIL